MNKPINIIFDGPPSHESGRFIEVETDDGKGISVGEWIERPDGCWALRITELPIDETDRQYSCKDCPFFGRGIEIREHFKVFPTHRQEKPEPPKGE